MFYFDYNATAPVLREAREAWLDATEQLHGNPSSPHAFGLAAHKAMSHAREKLAHHLGCHPADLIWTSGATEANNMALHHFAQTLDPQAEVWISAIEHPCVHDASAHYFGPRVKTIPVTHDGVVDLDWFTQEIADKRPGVVAVMCANNETGVIQPWRELLAICQAYEVPFFTDAVQWLGKMPAKGLGECDFVSGAARGRLSESPAPEQDQFPPVRRQTGTRPARRHGESAHHSGDDGRAGNPRKTDRQQRPPNPRRMEGEV
jgi:cysteine desulfurase